MNDIVAIAGALSDRSRLRALMSLRRGELCVCRIIELLGLAPSTVSKHMAILKNAGLVENRKEERWVYYRLPGSGSKAVSEAIAWVNRASENDATILADDKTVALTPRRGEDSTCRESPGALLTSEQKEANFR